MIKHLILTADDLGFTKGINKAVFMAHHQGFLTHASLMANAPFFEDAIDNVVNKSPLLKVGVHINLTCCTALTSDNVIAQKSKLDNTFFSLLFRFKSKTVLEDIEREIEAQIIRINNCNVEISHIDGHEHIHIIPSINRIVKKLARKHKITRVREINENIFESAKYNAKTATPINYIKLFLLKFLSRFNNNEKKFNFYSILNTCEINAQNLFHYLEDTKDERVEVMLHPSISEWDENMKDLDRRFIKFFNSPFRKQEFDICFNENFNKYAKAL